MWIYICQNMDQLQVDLQHFRQENRNKDIQIIRLATALKSSRKKGTASSAVNQPLHDGPHFQRSSWCSAVTVWPFFHNNTFDIDFLPNDHKSPLRWTSPTFELRGKIASFFSQFPRLVKDFEKEAEFAALLTANLQKTLHEDLGTQAYVRKLSKLRSASLISITFQTRAQHNAERHQCVKDVKLMFFEIIADWPEETKTLLKNGKYYDLKVLSLLQGGTGTYTMLPPIIYPLGQFLQPSGFLLAEHGFRVSRP